LRLPSSLDFGVDRRSKIREQIRAGADSLHKYSVHKFGEVGVGHWFPFGWIPPVSYHAALLRGCGNAGFGVFGGFKSPPVSCFGGPSFSPGKPSASCLSSCCSSCSSWYSWLRFWTISQSRPR